MPWTYLKCCVIWHRHNFSIVMSRGILGEFSLFPPCCSRPAFVVARLNRPRDILAKLIDWRGIHSQNERPDHVNAFPWINFRRLTMRRPLLLAPPLSSLPRSRQENGPWFVNRQYWLSFDADFLRRSNTLFPTCFYPAPSFPLCVYIFLFLFF